MIEYICMTCDSIFDSAALAPCPKCTSSSVIPSRVFKAYANAKVGFAAKQHGPSGPANNVVLLAKATPSATVPRVSQYGHKWEDHVASVRSMLLRNKLDSVASWWDGFHFLLGNSFADVNGPGRTSADPTQFYSDYFTLTLINKNRAVRVVTFFFNGEDEGMTEVSDEAKS